MERTSFKIKFVYSGAVSCERGTLKVAVAIGQKRFARTADTRMRIAMCPAYEFRGHFFTASKGFVYLFQILFFYGHCIAPFLLECVGNGVGKEKALTAIFSVRA
jgi:hypothetical protein